MSLSRLAIAATILIGFYVMASSQAAGPEYLASTPAPPRSFQGLAIGAVVRTASGERRRLDLGDGCVILVNEKSTLKRRGKNALVISAGEVFVASSPTVTVVFPYRMIKGRNVRFAVRADAEGGTVVAASGQVWVLGIDTPLTAGQQLKPDEKRPAPVGRMSQVVSWTQELLTDGMVPPSSHQGGSLMVLDPEGQEQRLALRRYQIDVHIEDGFARTTIDQTYFNHTHSRQEGTFRFPLRPDASLSRMVMYVDGQRNEGGMVEKDYGRIIYERIKYEQRDPALLEWVDGSTFRSPSGVRPIGGGGRTAPGLPGDAIVHEGHPRPAARASAGKGQEHAPAYTGMPRAIAGPGTGGRARSCGLADRSQ
jgi:hypothetical protein